MPREQADTGPGSNRCRKYNNDNQKGNWWRLDLRSLNLSNVATGALKTLLTSIIVPWWYALTLNSFSSCFRTVLLDNKDKKRATVPKPKTVVRKVTSLPQQSSSRTLTGGASGSSHGSSSTSHPPSSYSGLGPGRGQSLAPPPASVSHPRSHSPMSRQAHHHHSATANNSPSQPPAPPASHSQMPPAGSRTGFPSSLSSSSSAPPRPRPQVNTEIMKRPLRFVQKAIIQANGQWPSLFPRDHWNVLNDLNCLSRWNLDPLNTQL